MVHVPNNLVLGFWVNVNIVQILGRNMITGTLGVREKQLSGNENALNIKTNCITIHNEKYTLEVFGLFWE